MRKLSSWKITLAANSIPSKCFKFASRCLESSFAHWVKCTYGELRSVFGFLQKISWCAKGGHKQHLFQQHDFPFNVYKCVANSKRTSTINRSKYRKAMNTNFWSYWRFVNKILLISWLMTPRATLELRVFTFPHVRGILWLCYVHMP